MGGWYILGAALAVLALLLALPAGVRVRWDGQPLVQLCLGPLRFQIFPRKKARKSDETPEKSPKKEKPKKERKPRPKPCRDQIFYSIDRAARLLGKLLVRFRRGLRLDPLVLHLTVAGPDPADAAALYGRLYGALSALLPPLRRLVTTGHEDIRLSLDFDRTEWDIYADLGVSMRIWHLLAMGFAALGGLLAWAIGYRRRAPAPSPAAPPSEEPQKNG